MLTGISYTEQRHVWIQVRILTGESKDEFAAKLDDGTYYLTEDDVREDQTSSKVGDIEMETKSGKGHVNFELTGDNEEDN